MSLNKVMLGTTLVIVVTNPVSGQFILTGLDLMFREIFRYGSPINLIASAVMVGCIILSMWRSREKVNIPKKSTHTTKAGKFLEV